MASSALPTGSSRRRRAARLAAAPVAESAAGGQLALAESAVDLRAIVERLEDHVFTPLLERSDILTQQCLDRDVILKVAGADGVELVEQPIGVADLVGEYEWEWLGATTALNQQVRAQQMVQGMSVLAQLPPDALAQQGKQVDWAYVIKQYWTIGLGLRDADRVVKTRARRRASDWRWENALVRVGRAGEIAVSPADEHLEHARGHTELLEDEGRLTPEQAQALRAHVHEHMGLAIAAEVQAMQAAVAELTGGGPPSPMAPTPDGGPPPAGPAEAGAGAPPGGGLVKALAGAMGGGGAPGGPRPPAPLGPGRVGKTRGLDDLFRRLPRAPG